jgi:hypothetical protein
MYSVLFQQPTAQYKWFINFKGVAANISVHVYNLQGEQNTKNQLLMISCYLQGSSVCSSFVVDANQAQKIHDLK